jgi:hypothetical protein
MYVVDERAVARAIIDRAAVRMSVADSSFANAPSLSSTEVRSFRRAPRARSFRLPSSRGALH